MSKARKNLGVLCCVAVHNDHGVDFHQCQRFAVLTRGKRAYCKQHDPVAVAARASARQDSYDAEEALRTADHIRKDACIQACVGIPTEELTPGLVKRLRVYIEKLVKND